MNKENFGTRILLRKEELSRFNNRVGVFRGSNQQSMYPSLGRHEQTREHTYRELFRYQLDSDELYCVREALNQELVLGRDDFKDKIAAMIQRQVRPGPPGRPRVEEGWAINKSM